ncbi:MAG: electron transfer flavoprotein subunit alpha/FixB family protein [Proteobacteria bacterium]|nr:electron transfer flavoprotein subunit alpha/FixB family protein [Pseudomonadota bacterium]
MGDACLFWCMFPGEIWSELRETQLVALAESSNSRLVVLAPVSPAWQPSSRVEVVEVPEFMGTYVDPSRLARGIARSIEGKKCVGVLAVHSSRSARVLPWVAAVADWPFFSNMRFESEEAVHRIICVGRYLERLRVQAAAFCATLADDGMVSWAGPWPAAASGQRLCPGAFDRIVVPRLESFEAFGREGRPLDGARIVFGAGRGLGTRENFLRLEHYARCHGAAIAATRAVVDLGWVTNDAQVGQTGKIIAPEIYVAFGISGAIQHIAGVRSAKKIYAINADRDAPIFQYADVGVVADVGKILDQWLP